jgi:hypothetical protein
VLRRSGDDLEIWKRSVAKADRGPIDVRDAIGICLASPKYWTKERKGTGRIIVSWWRAGDLDSYEHSSSRKGREIMIGLAREWKNPSGWENMFASSIPCQLFPFLTIL